MMIKIVIILVYVLSLTFGQITVYDYRGELFQFNDDDIAIDEPLNNLLTKIKNILISNYGYSQHDSFKFRYGVQDIINNDDVTPICELETPISVRSEQPSNIYVSRDNLQSYVFIIIYCMYSL